MERIRAEPKGSYFNANLCRRNRRKEERWKQLSHLVLVQQ